MLTIVFTKSDDVALQLCSHFTLKPLGRNYECNVVTKLNHSQNIWKESSYGRANNSFVTNKQLHSYFKKSAVVPIDGGTFFFTYYRRRSNSMGSIFFALRAESGNGCNGWFSPMAPGFNLILKGFWNVAQMALLWGSHQASVWTQWHFQPCSALLCFTTGSLEDAISST